MGQHYTRNTVSADAWCAKCRKNTQHRVDDRRLGACLDCIARPLAERKPEKAVQESLFAQESHGGMSR